MPGWEQIGMEERQAIDELFDGDARSLLINKAKIREFETAFAATLGKTEAVAVSSGTAALKVALASLNLRPGDEVITQAHTFVATVEAIVEAGATPVIAEIDESLNMCPTSLRHKISPRTKVLLPVHMLGVAAKMTEIVALAGKARLAIVEDTAQACQGTYHGWPLGTLGDFGCFSFSYSKLLTTGEGGMVLARDPLNLARARSYADHGHDGNPSAPSRGQDTHARPGFNYRMSAVHAAIGLAQLQKVPHALKVHREHKAALKTALAGLHFREIRDQAGDIGDALCFFLENEKEAQRVARKLFEVDGIALKNLPDALNWHSAENWGHILGSQAAALHKSGALLRRTIALQICYKWTPADIVRVAAAVRGAL